MYRISTTFAFFLPAISCLRRSGHLWRLPQASDQQSWSELPWANSSIGFRSDANPRSLATLLVSNPPSNFGRSFRAPIRRGTSTGARALVPTNTPRRRCLPLALARIIHNFRSPLCIGVVAGAIVMQHRRAKMRKVTDDIALELGKLRNLTLMSPVEQPLDVRGSLQERRKSLSELQERTSMLADRIVPKICQLYQDSGQVRKTLRGLSQRSMHDLVEFDNKLAECIEVSGLVLAEYESLDQIPPPDLRQWSLAKLHEWHDLMTTKRSELRQIAKLCAQLGRQRMDWSLPEWSVERLQAHIEKLSGQVQDAKGRRARDELLGKIEAVLWQRGEDRPVASVDSLTIEELQSLLTDLQNGNC